MRFSKSLIFSALFGVVLSSSPALAAWINSAFVYSNGTFSIGGEPSRAYAINDNGIVVGVIGTGYGSGFVTNINTGVASNVRVPVGTFGVPYTKDPLNPTTFATSFTGINNAGDILGSFIDGSTGVPHDFLDIGGTFSAPGVYAPGAYGSDTNAAGDFVGYTITPGVAHGQAFLNHAVSYLNQNGVITTLDYDPDPKHHISTFALGLNNNGDVVGYIAVPEPSSLSLFASGLMLLAGLTWMRRRSATTLV